MVNTGVVVAATIPLFFSFLGAIYSYGRLVSKVEGLSKRMDSLESRMHSLENKL